jgi:hypothetical protein
VADDALSAGAVGAGREVLGARRMSVKLSDFLEGSLGEGGTGLWLEAALAAPLEGEQAARPDFLAFHAAHVRGSKDNAAINSLCLPVFANGAAQVSAVAEPERSSDSRGAYRGSVARGGRGGHARGGAARGGAARGGGARGGASRGSASRGAARGGAGRGRGSGRRDSATTADGAAAVDGPASEPGSDSGSDLDAELFVTRSGRPTKRKAAPPGSGAHGGPTRRTLSEEAGESGEVAISVRGFDESRPVPSASQESQPGKAPRKVPVHLPDYTQQYQQYAGPISVSERMELKYDGEPRALDGLVTLDAQGRVTSVPGLRIEGLPPLLHSQLMRLRLGGFRLVGIAPEELPSADSAAFERSISRTIHRVKGIKGVAIVPSALWAAVEARGGFNKVRIQRLWLEVKAELQLPDSTSSSFTLRETFTEYFDVSQAGGRKGGRTRGWGNVETQPFGYVVGRLREEKTQHASPSEPSPCWGLLLRRRALERVGR